jgi:hypothetical protein
MSPRPLVRIVEQVPEIRGSSLRSAEAVKGLRPLCGSRGEPLTVASLRLCGSQGEWPAIPLTGTQGSHGQSVFHPRAPEVAMRTLAEACSAAIAFAYRSIDRLILNGLYPDVADSRRDGHLSAAGVQ